MRIEILSHENCPFAGELTDRIKDALRLLKVDAPCIGHIISTGDEHVCPALLIDERPVCSCIAGTTVAAHCRICGSAPDIPDEEIIRWHMARSLGLKTVLFICSGNAVRSQMAEAIVNHTLGETWAAFSGGIIPMQLWAPVKDALQEIGIDSTGRKAKHLELFLGCRFDLIISLCSDADAFCTAFPGEGVRDHMPFDDPMTSSFFGIGDAARTRKLRDDMRLRIVRHMERRS